MVHLPMKKLLIICPHYNDNHVSSFRISAIERECEIAGYIVNILTLGTKLSLGGRVSTVVDNHFKNNFTHLFTINKNKVAFYDFFNSYDCVVISMPNFKFIQLLDMIPERVKVVLDYRDQIDFDYFSRQSKFSKNKIAKLLSYLDMINSYRVHAHYIRRNIGKVLAITCVGEKACESFSSRMISLDAKLFNVHNGFDYDDLHFLKNSGSCSNSDFEKNVIKIGLSGSIYDFRCSDTLYSLFSSIIEKAEGLDIQIYHWGSSCKKLLEILSHFKKIKYFPVGRMQRKTYLDEIYKMDYLLLLCSDNICWEPTTTVFDYILLKKPIIYCGNECNEAVRILNDCKVNYKTYKNSFDFDSTEMVANYNVKYDDLLKYERQRNASKFVEIFSLGL